MGKLSKHFVHEKIDFEFQPHPGTALEKARVFRIITLMRQKSEVVLKINVQNWYMVYSGLPF